VLAIERTQFSNPWTADHFQAELLNSFSHFYVAETREGGSLAGFMIFWRLDSELELHKVAVSPTCLRRGYGASLLDFFVATARSWHCRQALLEVRASNKAAIRLYETNHFQCIGRRRDYYSHPSEDALIFRWVIETD